MRTLLVVSLFLLSALLLTPMAAAEPNEMIECKVYPSRIGGLVGVSIDPWTLDITLWTGDLPAECSI